MPRDFRKLFAYQLADALADDLHRIVPRWPPDDRATGRQVLRAIDSVGANIAEAAGRYGYPDRRRHLMIARGSIVECEHFLASVERRGLVPPGTADRASHAAAVLNLLINSQPH